MKSIGLPVTVDAVPVASLLDLSLEVAGASLMPILTTLGVATLVAFMVVMMLLETESFRNNVRRGLRDKSSAEFFASVHGVTRQFQTFFFTKTLVSLLTGVVTALFTYAMGIDFPFIWGTLAFLLNYIPNIGSMISVVPPVLVALVQFEAPGRAFAAGIGLTTIQMVIGNFIDPRAMGRSLSLSPFVVFASMIFWGWMWGLPGIFLSVPLTILIRIVFEHIPVLRAVAIMMGGPEPEAPEQGTRPIDDDEIAAALSQSAALTPTEGSQTAR
jgi:AI-2 transport protein TqsA